MGGNTQIGAGLLYGGEESKRVNKGKEKVQNTGVKWSELEKQSTDNRENLEQNGVVE